MLIATALLTLLACQKSPEGGERSDQVEPMSRGTSSDLIARGAAYARQRLGFTAPVLSYVLLACIDGTGALDPNLDACPGSMIATFVERDQTKGDLAFIALGRAGMIGRRTLYGTAISFDPPRCTPAALLAVPRARDIQWDRAETTILGYEPRGQAPPMWTLKRKGTPLLELSDADCAAARLGE